MDRLRHVQGATTATLGGHVFYVHRWRDPFGAGGKVTTERAWKEGATVADLLESEGDVAVRQGVELLPSDRILPGDHIDVGSRPGFLAALFGIQGVLGFFIDLIAGLVVSVAASAIVRALSPKPRGPRERGDSEKSPTYSFSGIQNIRVEGSPLPIYGGRIRTGGVMIQEFTRVVPSSPPRSDYYALLSFGEGPVQSLAGVSEDNLDSPIVDLIPGAVLVDGNDLANFQDYEVYVRLGTPDQEPIPGFEVSRSQDPVGVELAQDPGSNSATVLDLTPGGTEYRTPAIVDPLYGSRAFSYSMTDSADRGIVVIDFPAGLYRVDDQANLQPAYFGAVIRYIELDSGGNPITTGGDNNDGYVYLVPEVGVSDQDGLRSFKTQSQFQQEYPIVFFDPQTWTPPTPGEVAIADDVGWLETPAYTDLPPPPTSPTSFAYVGRSVDFWFKVSGASLTDTFQQYTIFEFSNGASSGFALVWERLYSNFYDSWVNVVSLQTTTGFKRGTLRVFTDVWYHATMSYWVRDANGAGGKRTVWSLWINGSLYARRTDANVAADFPDGTPTSPVGYFGSPNAGSGPNFSVGGSNWPVGTIRGFEEYRFWDRILDDGDAAFLYASGAGRYLTPNDDSSIFTLWHFDNTPGPANTDDVRGYVMTGGPAPANYNIGTTGAGITPSPVSSPGINTTTKQSRYRVEVLRANLNADDVRVQDKSNWSFFINEIDIQFSYPSQPLLGIRLRASEQLNTTAPTILPLIEGVLCPVWDGVDAVNPSVSLIYSANPAWFALKLILDEKTGLGDLFPLSKVDLVTLYEVAQESDVILRDGRGAYANGPNDALGGGATEPARTWHEMIFATPAEDTDLGTGYIDLILHQNATSRLKTSPLPHWKPGYLLGFSGIVTPQQNASILVDLNFESSGGFEIREFRYVSLGWRVRLNWKFAGIPWNNASLGGFSWTTVVPLTFQGDVVGVIRQFEFNGVLDEFRSAWENLLDVLSVARATPIRDGDRLRFRVERARPPVALVTQAAINSNNGKSTFRYEFADNSERPNAYSVDFLDGDNNYALSPEFVPDPLIEDTTLAEAVREEPIFALGVADRPHAVLFGKWLLSVNRYATRRGGFTTGAGGISWEPGDRIAIAHDLAPFGQGGRLRSDATVSELKLARRVVLESGESYLARVQNPLTPSNLLEVVTVTATDGTYEAGDAISISPDLSFAPAGGEEVIVYTADEEFSVIVTGWRLDSAMNVEVEWVEYNSNTYDVTLEDDEVVLAATAPAGNPGPQVFLASVFDVSVFEQTVREAGTTFTLLAAGWSYDPEEIQSVAGAEIYQKVDDSGPWELAATIRGSAAVASWRAPALLRGQVVRVSVCPVSPGGARRDPARGTQAEVLIQADAGAPRPVTGLEGRLVDRELALFSWTPSVDSVDQSVVGELRVGGWILGQKLEESAPGASSIGPTRSWLESTGSAPRYILRPRSSIGSFGPALELASFAPSVALTDPYTPTDGVDGVDIFPDQAWESFADGWVYDGPPAGPVSQLSGLERHADGYLEFTDPGLDGYFQSADWEGYIGLERAERVYVHAFVDADAVHPLTFADALFQFGSPRAQRHSFEGPIRTFSDETPNPTLEILISVLDRTTEKGGTGWSLFEKYRPGVYFGIGFRFQLQVTRPSTSYQIKIRSFRTRIVQAQRQRFEYTPLERAIQRKTLRSV